MKTIFSRSEADLMADAINRIGSAVHVVKYQGRLQSVRLVLAEGRAHVPHSLLLATPPVAAESIARVMT